MTVPARRLVPDRAEVAVNADGSMEELFVSPEAEIESNADRDAPYLPTPVSHKKKLHQYESQSVDALSRSTQQHVPAAKLLATGTKQEDNAATLNTAIDQA